MAWKRGNVGKNHSLQQGEICKLHEFMSFISVIITVMGDCSPTFIFNF